MVAAAIARTPVFFESLAVRVEVHRRGGRTLQSGCRTEAWSTSAASREIKD